MSMARSGRRNFIGNAAHARPVVKFLCLSYGAAPSFGSNSYASCSFYPAEGEFHVGRSVFRRRPCAVLPADRLRAPLQPDL